MSHTNRDVINAFMNHQTLNSSTQNCRTDGNKLWSYRTVIAQWHQGKVIINTTKYSPTTSGKHMSPLKNHEKLNRMDENGDVLYTFNHMGYGVQDLTQHIEEPGSTYLSYQALRKIIKDLAKSQGFYGRLDAEIEDNPNMKAQLKRWAKDKKFKEPVDFILYLEG